MVIHTFGDSHSYYGWVNIPNILTHHLGPKLCFSIGRDGINIKDGYNVNNGDTVIFCFGEIDCRCHIHKHITEGADYKQIIDIIVTNYFKQIGTAVNTFNNINTVIYNVVPPIQKHNTVENPDFPYLGTDNERKTYVLYFNEKLKQMCNEYNFYFFNVYNDYIDINGFLNKSLSDGNVHIRDEVYLKRSLTDLDRRAFQMGTNAYFSTHVG
jgi:lysophospholipase L1-like esterase